MQENEGSLELADLRFQQALEEFADENCGVISYQSALEAAQGALRKRDYETAVRFCRCARDLIERQAHSMGPIGKNVRMSTAMFGKGRKTRIERISR
jgi:hypothetical protein